MPEPAAGRLAGKVALISGASRGQGEAEARLFVSEGAEVILGDVLDKQGEAVAEDLGDAAIYRHHDVTSESDWADIVAAGRQEFGHIDVLVNNAGVFRVMSMLDTSLEEYRRVTEINQTGVFLGMKAVAPVMIEQGHGGSIINISSVAGLRGAATTFAYGASKWAVRGMTKGAARELAAVPDPGQLGASRTHLDHRCSRSSTGSVPASTSNRSCRSARSPDQRRWPSWSFSWPRRTPGIRPAPSSWSTAA